MVLHTFTTVHRLLLLCLVMLKTQQCLQLSFLYTRILHNSAPQTSHSVAVVAALLFHDVASCFSFVYPKQTSVTAALNASFHSRILLSCV